MNASSHLTFLSPLVHQFPLEIRPGCWGGVKTKANYNVMSDIIEEAEMFPRVVDLHRLILFGSCTGRKMSSYNRISMLIGSIMRLDIHGI